MGEEKDLPRRRFLSLSVGSIGGIIGLGYLGVLGDFIKPPAAGAEPLAEVGKVGDFQVGSPKLVSYKHGGVEQGVFVINKGDQGWLALDFHCTHLGCAVNWLEATKSFLCPCHGGQYDINGTVKGGPPPHALHQRLIQVQGDSVMVGGRIS